MNSDQLNSDDDQRNQTGMIGTIRRTAVWETGVSWHHGGWIEVTLKLIQHHSIMVSRCSRRALSCSPWCRETAVRLAVEVFPVYTRVFSSLYKSIFRVCFQSIQEYFPCRQVRSVVTSSFTLAWSFTTYHRKSKLGGLSYLSSVPIFFSFFFQVQLSVTLEVSFSKTYGMCLLSLTHPLQNCNCFIL